MIVEDYQENYITGWISIYRSIQFKGWYQKSEFVHLWIHLLVKANHKEREFWFNGQNVKVKKGQFVTGRKQLSLETGISESKIERILKAFESEQQIEQQKNNRNRLISILNYEQYQKSEQQTNSKRTTTEQQVNTNNNDNNNNKIDIDWSKLLNKFNSITSKKSRVVTDKAKKQIQARLKEGYSKEDIIRAIENCYKDKYHQETNHKYLTLEFISRPEKLEKFASIDKKELSIEEKKAQLIKLMHNVH